MPWSKAPCLFSATPWVGYIGQPQDPGPVGDGAEKEASWQKAEKSLPRNQKEEKPFGVTGSGRDGHAIAPMEVIKQMS